MADLEYQVEQGIGTILLNRPAKKNAFTIEMIDRWAQIISEARQDDAVSVIILTGAGDAFCAGGDLGDLAQSSKTPLESKLVLTEHIHRIALVLEDLDKPVIAAVNGVAVGAGMDFALMCDMRFAARSARFSEGYIRVGLVPGDGGAYYLPRLVGIGKALELLLTGDFIDAEEALRIGIVNRVYEDDRLLDETRAFATRIAAGPPRVMQMIKRAVYQSSRSDLRTSLDLISSHMGIVQSTHDSQEAIRAFREKRSPHFEGR
jgi:enoyl-CoA hydratase/carnithine racemase